MPTGSHFEFAFLHKSKVYGVARLLYGVATSDSVCMADMNIQLILIFSYNYLYI